MSSTIIFHGEDYAVPCQKDNKRDASQRQEPEDTQARWYKNTVLKFVFFWKSPASKFLLDPQMLEDIVWVF